MQFLIYSAEFEAPRQDGAEAMAEIAKFMEESTAAGIIVAAGGLPRKSTRLRLSGGKVSVTDGPFIEGKEFIPGFAIIQVDTKEDAIDWVTRLRKVYGDGESRIVMTSFAGTISTGNPRCECFASSRFRSGARPTSRMRTPYSRAAAIAPSTSGRGAWSPPIASTAMVIIKNSGGNPCGAQ